MADYTCHVVDRGGSVDEEIKLDRRGTTNPKLLRLGIGTWKIAFSLDDEGAIAGFPCMETLNREIELRRDGVVVWRGVPDQKAEIDWVSRMASVNCRTLEAYADEKVFGRADRIDLLTDGGFEANPIDAAWVEVGDVTATIEASIVNEGAQAIRLTSATGVGYIEQTLPATITSTFDPALPLFVSGWLYLEDAVADRTNLIQLEASGAHPESPFTEEFVSDPNFTPGVFRQVGTNLGIGPDVTWTIKVRIFAIPGDVVADSFAVYFSDSTTVLQPGEDLKELVENIVEYSQTGGGQSNELLGLNCDLTGIVVFRGYDHSEHDNIYRDGLLQLALDYGVDIWVDLERDWRLAVKRGEYRPELDVAVTNPTADSPGMQPRVTIDPTQVKSSIIVRVENGTFVDEIGVVDTSELDGMVRTEIVKSPLNSTIRSAREFGENTLERMKRPAVLPTLRYPYTECEPGDTFLFSADDGWAQIPERVCRIEALTIDIASDTIEVAADFDWVGDGS